MRPWRRSWRRLCPPSLIKHVGAIQESPVSQLTTCGVIVDAVIQSIPEHLHVTIDRYVIMPNHVHLIVVIAESDVLRAIRESPLQGRSIVSKAVGYIKMNASKVIRQQYGDVSVWQRGYHDHVIRNRDDYGKWINSIQKNEWEICVRIRN